MPQGKIIGWVNQKGGVSKSTSLVHYAVWLKRQGFKVLAVDADAQQSSSFWLSRMDDPVDCKVLSGADELLDKLPELKEGCDYVVVDGPGAIGEVTRAILFRADIAIIPTQPTGMDSHSSADTIRLIKQAQSVRGGEPQAIIFLSRAVPRTKLTAEARRLLQRVPGVTLAKACVHNRQAIADSFGQATTVWNMKDASKAAAEYELLFEEIMGYVNA